MRRIAIVMVIVLSGCTTAQINQTLGEVNKSLGGGTQLTTEEVA